MSDHTHDAALQRAIDTMAAVVHNAIVETAIQDGDLWATWPEIGEHDWNWISTAVGEYASRPPQDEIDRATEFLAARAKVHKEDGR